ncbi:glycoside hydrolase family 43 protein [Streptomyces sp. ME19-01-6]|uniref:glycoside hydrolase family 43 protein n=1 Tax=Streptomyces sp. ME19-01-6 TaxID=3028686 RepID=UPI0029B1FBBB|nr:glycoside hydrolase family 43 protein [Streptomyces sp. ME19-01-6]MDX3228291.1 glycoside hydrolase family 43 protein [Streptomyces sp. ME19-01-6]
MTRTRTRALPLLAAALLALLALLQTGGAPAARAVSPAAGADSAVAAGTFTNPIVTQNGADPTIIRYAGYYYHLGTTWASHWEMRRATTLGGLKTAAPTTIYRETVASRCCNFWAPELHRLNGPNGLRWYLTYSAGVSADIDHQHVHVLESAGNNPLGPYTYKGQVDPYGDNRWMIDSSYLSMPDGRLYMLYSFWEGGTQNLYAVRMSNPWTPTGGAVRIASPTYSWEKVGSGVNEGPTILQHGGRTFLTFSASHCNTPDYKLGLMELTGSDPLAAGAWKKFANPVFQRSDANGVYGPGHNFFFPSPDGKEVWMAYHANSKATDGCSGTRTTRAQKVNWNADGTPNFGTPASTSTALAEPSGTPAAAGR